MFNIPSFSAIINPPQSCILAVGGLQKVVVPDEGKFESVTFVFVVIIIHLTITD